MSDVDVNFVNLVQSSYNNFTASALNLSQNYADNGVEIGTILALLFILIISILLIAIFIGAILRIRKSVTGH